VPELSVAIGSNGEPVYVEAFGSADRENQERLTPQHLLGLQALLSLLRPSCASRIVSLALILF
jgi:hypothetical protein